MMLTRQNTLTLLSISTLIDINQLSKKMEFTLVSGVMRNRKVAHSYDDSGHNSDSSERQGDSIVGERYSNILLIYITQ
jgi:hypothetical protein